MYVYNRALGGGRVPILKHLAPRASGSCLTDPSPDFGEVLGPVSGPVTASRVWRIWPRTLEFLKPGAAIMGQIW